MIERDATALAAAGSASALRIQNIVILTVSCLSSAGALSIILSFLVCYYFSKVERALTHYFSYFHDYEQLDIN